MAHNMKDSVCVCVCMCVHICMYVCMYACMYVCILPKTMIIIDIDQMDKVSNFLISISIFRCSHFQIL